MPERKYTQAHRKRIGRSLKYRKLINTGTKIDEGVLVVGFDAEISENVVVDWDKYRDKAVYSLPAALSSSLNLAEQETGQENAKKIADYVIARAVFENVNKVMKYDKTFVEKKIEQYGAGRKMSLQAVFMKNRRGICRHQGLIAAAVMERLYRQGVLKGTGIINENLIDGNGHLWAEYVNADGVRLVLDPAKGYFGKPGGGNWNYNPRMSVSEINPELL